MIEEIILTNKTAWLNVSLMSQMCILNIRTSINRAGKMTTNGTVHALKKLLNLDHASYRYNSE